MKAYVLINIRNAEIGEVVKQLRRAEGVKEAHMTFGPYDAVVTMEISDINKLGKVISQNIQPIPGVDHTLTCIAVES